MSNIEWDVETKWPDRAMLEEVTDLPVNLKKELGILVPDDTNHDE